MPLRAIAYASEAVEGFSFCDTEELIRAAASFNSRAGVTGVLLFDGVRFLQYIEGPEDGIEAVYSRILADKQHKKLMELGRGRVPRRHFPFWAMKTVVSISDEMQMLSRADWSGMRCIEGFGEIPSSGLLLLQGVLAPSMPPMSPSLPCP
ncbi:blue light sensor protein [Stenotrophomonas sp. YAU14D1_LEIMI4_1]|nr:blue light sensor protein [Stenotrophomonas sp. YAU14D1_LEIMI4_1]